MKTATIISRVLLGLIFVTFGLNMFLTTRTVDQTISSLRRKLGDDAESPRYLITVYGVGYTLGTFTSYAPESRKTARALR